MLLAVILAGGEGTRLRPLTERLPKALVPVQGKPFLQHQLERLRAGGVTDVLLLVCYRGEQIEAFFRDGARLGLRLRYVYEGAPRGTAGALKNAEPLLPEEFLLLNGDTLLEMDYAALEAAYRERGKHGLVVAWENPDGQVANNLALEADQRVIAYHKRNPAGLTHMDAGVAVFSRRVLGLIPSGRVVSLEEEVYPRLIERQQLWGFPTRARFYDMGSRTGLEALEGELAAMGARRR